MRIFMKRSLAILSAVFGASLIIMASVAEAQRAGRGGSVGNRGTRTDTTPPPTATAPGPAQALPRANTAQPRPTGPVRAIAPAAAQAAKPSFARSLMTGIGAGLLGAGLFGLFTGSGFFSGMASLAGFFGFLLQVLLIGGLAYLAFRFIRGRQAALAAASGITRLATPRAKAAGPVARQTLDIAPAITSPPTEPIAIDERDYSAFEQTLYRIQSAYGRGDIGTLRLAATPEVAAYFEEEIAGYRERNWEYRIGEVQLLQGDLSEAWSEPNVTYATVAMRYSIFAATYDHTAKMFVEGDPNKPQVVTEYWTFVTENGPVRNWKLAAIQQVEPQQGAA